MLRLTGSNKLQVVLSGAATASRLTVSYMDFTAVGAPTGGTQLSVTNGATPVDICDAPAASTTRQVDHIRLVAKAVMTATFSVHDGTAREWGTITLASGDVFDWSHSGGVTVLDANGNAKTVIGGAVAATTLTASGAVSFSSTFTSRGIIDNATATALTITSGGITGIGTANPAVTNKNTVTPKLTISGAGVLGSTQIVRHTTPGSGGAIFTLSATRGTDANAYTIVQSGDGLGSFVFSGADGVQQVAAAQIACAVDGTPGTDDMPGRLIFLTTPDNSATLTEAMRIDSTQTVTLGGANTAPALSVIPVASQNRWVTITGSNSGNPTISTSAGNLNLGPASGTTTVSGPAAARLSIVSSSTNDINLSFSNATGARASINSNNSGSLIYNAQVSGGTHIFYSNNGSATLLQVSAAAPTDPRYVTISSASASGNPAIGVSAGSLNLSSAVVMSSLGAFASGDKYLIVDASGNVHKSALGPAS